MRLITIRTLVVKALFAVLIYVFLKEPNQYWLVPLFYLLGSFVATLWSYLDIYKRFNIYFIHVTAKDIFDEIKISLPFFVSRIATTACGATNTLVLKSIYPSNTEIGYYTSAEKMVSVARSAASPISDSLYPYMVRNKDYKIIIKLLICIMPIVMIGCGILWLYSVPICLLIFGPEYAGAGEILRYMIPLMVMALPVYVLGFPSLVPLGLSHVANFSNVLGALIQLTGLMALLLMKSADIYNICILTNITELSVLVTRLCAVFYGIKKIKKCISE